MRHYKHAKAESPQGSIYPADLLPAVDKMAHHDFRGMMAAVKIDPVTDNQFSIQVDNTAGAFGDMRDKLSLLPTRIGGCAASAVSNQPVTAGSCTTVSALVKHPLAGFKLSQAVNVASRLLVSFAPTTDGLASAKLDQELYHPSTDATHSTQLPTTLSSGLGGAPSISTIHGIGNDWQPSLAAIARHLALTRGGKHRLSEAEEHLLRCLQFASVIAPVTHLC